MSCGFFPFVKVRNGIEIVGDDGEGIAWSDEETAFPQDHVSIPVAVEGNAQNVVALMGGREEKR